MRDALGRELSDLRLSVTDLCNYRCRYCMPAQGVPKRGHEEILSVEECVEIAGAAILLGVKKVRLTGGEPLVRHGVIDIARGIGALAGLEELCMTTNGALLPKYARKLREAGVRRVNLSLDTLRPERFSALTRLGTLNEALAGLRVAVDVFEQVKINAVLMGGVNDDEILDLIGLTQQWPVEVRFIELMPMGETQNWPAQRFVSADAVLTACPKLLPLSPSGVAERYRLPGAAGTVGLIRPMTHSFCASCGRIRVTADGKLKPCLHSREEIPLRGLHGEALLQKMREGIWHKP
ncbi:MAG: GTP 3',8-cyclase MoaA, partial [Clostridia bacterium]|nr:GTP 3',8-cyclase MoaA [Clostridia bacterium]